MPLAGPAYDAPVPPAGFANGEASGGVGEVDPCRDSQWASWEGEVMASPVWERGAVVDHISTPVVGPPKVLAAPRPQCYSG